MAKGEKTTEFLTPAMQDEIIEALENGVTVRRFFKEHAKGRATYGKYLKERRANEAFADRIDRAREDYCEAAIEDALDIQLNVIGDHRLASAAQANARTVFKAAELLAPDRFGPRTKIDMPEQLAVSIVHHHDHVHRLDQQTNSRSIEDAPASQIAGGALVDASDSESTP